MGTMVAGDGGRAAGAPAAGERGEGARPGAKRSCTTSLGAPAESASSSVAAVEVEAETEGAVRRPRPTSRAGCACW